MNKNIASTFNLILNNVSISSKTAIVLQYTPLLNLRVALDFDGIQLSFHQNWLL